MATQIQVFDQLKHVVSGLSKKQRIMLIAGAVLTLVTLLVFVKLISKPDYKPLFTDLEQQDAQRLAEQLATKKIPYELSPDGKVLSVPADQVDTARIAVASEGMPHSGRLGFELFDKVSWGQTEFDEKVNYQRAMEGELERTIQTLRDVQSARVHLVLPTESVFITRERPAKASVIIKTKRGELSQDSQMAISRLVAGAVDGLSPENVIVTDADTNRPLGGRKSAGWIADEDQERLLTARLMTTLEPVIGADHVRATVDVEYDPSTMEENQDSYDPDSQVAVTKQTSEEQSGSNGGTGGVPGTSSNIPGAKIAAQADASSDAHMSKSDAQTYAVNRVSRHTLQPAGRIRRITAAVAVDDIAEASVPGQAPRRRKWSPEELAKIEQLAQASLGIDTNRGDHLAVENVSFEQPAQAAPPKASVVEKVRTTLHDWSTAVRYASLLLLFVIAYLLMLRPVKREIIAAFRAIAHPEKEEADAAGATEDAASSLPSGFELFGEEAQTVKKQLIERVKKDPLAASRLIQSWVDEDLE
jgi:flagellar M-ring protein FliF